jgi:hypothetical protein
VSCKIAKLSPNAAPRVAPEAIWTAPDNPIVVGEKSYSYEEEGSSHSAKREKEEDSSLLSEVDLYAGK